MQDLRMGDGPTPKMGDTVVVSINFQMFKSKFNTFKFSEPLLSLLFLPKLFQAVYGLRTIYCRLIGMVTL